LRFIDFGDESNRVQWMWPLYPFIANLWLFSLI